MDFVVVMLFTQQVFHLQGLFFFYLQLIPYYYYFESNLSQVVDIKVLPIKSYVFFLQSSKHEEITLLLAFIFVFNLYLFGQHFQTI